MFRALQSPIENERGERLLAVREGGVGVENASVSIVLAHHSEGVVLVRNTHRSIWELPGGYIDTGERPSDCALRELFEESGLTGSDAELLGILEIERRARVGGLLRCAVYQCDAKGVPSVDGVETSAVAFWQPGAEIAPISAIDEALLRGGLRGCI
jgi:8-oxo-dGTP pyrophosphatase MutT (NUDIX family)